MEKEPPSFWDKIKRVALVVYGWTLKYPIAIIGTVLLMVMAVLAMTMGKNIQIGGLLESLWGKKEPKNNRLVVPDERTDDEGEPIKPGESDDEGYVQVPAKITIKEPGIFSDPDKIEIIDEMGNGSKIPLPKGVKNSDVEEVVVVKPNVYEVKNKDGGVNVVDLDNLINDLE